MGVHFHCENHNRKIAAVSGVWVYERDASGGFSQCGQLLKHISKLREVLEYICLAHMKTLLPTHHWEVRRGEWERWHGRWCGEAYVALKALVECAEGG